MRYYDGEEMNERTLHAGPRAFAGIRNVFDKNKFASDVPNLLKMNHRLRFEDRFAKVQSNLFGYLDENNLYENVMPRGKWNSGAGSVVMKAMLRELCPPEYKRTVQTLVEMNEVANDPEELLMIMEQLGEKQKKGRK